MEHDKGVKFDEGKSRLDLLNPRFLRDIAKKLEEGETNYGYKNYLKGLDEKRIIAAALRHIFEIMDGEWVDETGVSHAGAVGANMQMLHEIHTQKATKAQVVFKDVPRSRIAGHIELDRLAFEQMKEQAGKLEKKLANMLVEELEEQMRTALITGFPESGFYKP